jgi:hypothetical protein
MLMIQTLDSSVFEFKYGQELPIMKNVILLSATGETLEEIKRLFKNIPMVENSIVTWYGETANFIYINYLSSKMLNKMAVEDFIKTI